jgi:hypothetical protein
MIDKNKTYKTRNGREVRIYAVDGAGSHSVHGAVKDTTEGEWHQSRWSEEGWSDTSQVWDLIEVKPRIKRTVWLNVEAHCADAYTSKENADRWPKRRLACVKVEIDCEEGEGL